MLSTVSELSTNMARLISEAALSHVDHGGWEPSPEGLRCAGDGALVVPDPEWLKTHVEQPAFEAYAWIGEDEMGSGQVGFKAGFVPAGFIPLVAASYDRHKIDRPQLREQMQATVNNFGKPYRLVRLVAVEEVDLIEPEQGRTGFDEMTPADIVELREEATLRQEATAAVNRIRTLVAAGVPLQEAKVTVWTRMDGAMQERVDKLWQRYEEDERRVEQSPGPGREETNAPGFPDGL